MGEKYVLFLSVWSNVPNRPNDHLMREKGGRGFPHLVLMDGTGKVLHKFGGWRSAAGLQQTAQAYDEFTAKSPGIASGEAQPDADFTMSKLVLDKAKYGETVKAMAKFTLTDKQKKRWAVIQPHFEFMDILTQVQGQLMSPGDAGKKFLGWKGTAKEPTGGFKRRVFLQLLMAHAKDAKDVKLFEECTVNMKKFFKKEYGDHPQLPRVFQQLDDQLAKFKAENAPKKDDGGFGFGG